MGGGPSIENDVTNVMNEMTAQIIVNIQLSCNANSESYQLGDIECTPDPSALFEANNSCKSCIDKIKNGAVQYYINQQKLWESGAILPAVNKPINEDFQTIIQGFIGCTRVCKKCIVQDVSQSTFTEQQTNCQAFNNVSNSISQQLTDSVAQQLTNNQDMLAPLATLLGHSHTSEVIHDITTRMSVQITDTVLQDIVSQIKSDQYLYIKSGTVRGITQNSTYKATVDYLAQNNIFNGVFTDNQWDDLNTLYNDQNTIDGLGNAVVKGVQYLQKLINNVVGQVVLFVLILVGVVFIGIIIYIVANIIRNAIRKQQEADIQVSHLADTQPAYETF